jgi:hypothetical protein
LPFAYYSDISSLGSLKLNNKNYYHTNKTRLHNDGGGGGGGGDSTQSQNYG